LLGDPLPQAANPVFVTCQRGLSVPANDAAAFADGLGYLVDNSTLRREIGERGLLFVESKYSKDRLLEDVSALYTDLMAGKTASMKAPSRENRLESGI
jgi:glycosyltransferase involved in cell wall biosynthesis